MDVPWESGWYMIARTTLAIEAAQHLPDLALFLSAGQEHLVVRRAHVFNILRSMPVVTLLRRLTFFHGRFLVPLARASVLLLIRKRR